MRIALTTPLLLAAFAITACSSDGNGNADAGAPNPNADGSTGPGADGGVADTGAPDTGPPPCQNDQDCMSGEVCNVVTRVCGPGRACTPPANPGDPDTCDDCSRITGGAPADCGHGFHVNAYCSASRGNVCTRALAACEECATDEECGDMHPSLRAVTEPSKCVEYGNGKKYCARDSTTVGCPFGFQRDPLTGLCRRIEGCPEAITICPAKPSGAGCTGEQTCYREECVGVPGSPAPLCATNDVPGALGICIGACDDNADCTDPAFPVCNLRNGLCISGCTKDSCAGGKVCHADGFCADPCADDNACEMKFGNANYYCNQSGRVTQPRQFKDYRDTNSCAPLGCEQAVDCPAAGLVCDKNAAPPTCVMGCFTKDDCLSGEVCKDPGAAGPQPSYNRQQCRGLAVKADDTALGVCCNPGCTDRVLQCDIMEFCCAEEDSPYEDPNTCGQVEDPVSMQTRRAEPGECFDINPKPTTPFCQICDDMNPCNSDNFNGMGANWTFGYNQEPPGMGTPFREQEFCFQVAQNLNMCGVSCNPNALDSGCPRGWQCDAFEPGCLQDADCNGLTCDGEDTTVDPPRQGRCLCGEGGQQTAMCPQTYAMLGEAVNLPRCGPPGGDGKMFCVASYMCMPPPVREVPPMSMMYNYPAACLGL